jgi:hypothetical protein
MLRHPGRPHRGAASPFKSAGSQPQLDACPAFFSWLVLMKGDLVLGRYLEKQTVLALNDGITIDLPFHI